MGVNLGHDLGPFRSLCGGVGWDKEEIPLVTVNFRGLQSRRGVNTAALRGGRSINDMPTSELAVSAHVHLQ